MKCDCVKKVTGALTKYHGEKSDIQLELKQTFIPSTMEMGVAFPPIYYSYQPPKGKRKKAYLTFNFCPFCGEKQ